jgi:hypothetical protein
MCIMVSDLCYACKMSILSLESKGEMDKAFTAVGETPSIASPKVATQKSQQHYGL